LNGLNPWCKVTTFDLKAYELGEGAGQALAETLRVNTTLDLGFNSLGEGGAQAIAAALRVNTTRTKLDLCRNSHFRTIAPHCSPLVEGAGQAIAAALRVNSTLTKLDICYNELGEGGAQEHRQLLRHCA